MRGSRASGPRDNHTCPGAARDAHGRGLARIVVRSELDLEPRLATIPLARAGRRASGTIVRVFDAVFSESRVERPRETRLLGELATPPGEASSARGAIFERFWASNTFGSSPYAIYLTTNVTTARNVFLTTSHSFDTKKRLSRAPQGAKQP